MLGRAWGDWYFAESLAQSFNRLGRDVRFEFWVDDRHTKKKKKRRIPNRLPFRREIDLVIRGTLPYRPVLGRKFFIWVISQAESLTEEELNSARHIFVASEPYARTLAAKGLPVSYLPQCTDPSRFQPFGRDPALASDVLFVGNWRSYAPRPVVDLALRAGADLSVWGRSWDGKLPDGVLRGASIENEVLGRYYASANVVLNDHTETMLRHGFLSNRAYDVLATGRPLLNETMPGIPDDLREHLYLYDAETFAGQLALAQEEAGKDRTDISAYVRAHHSFDARAAAICNAI